MRGLVFGHTRSSTLAAHALARKHWRSSGARNEAEARSWWVSICRRRIGVAVARAYARYRIRRMVFIGVPRAVLDDRARRGVAGVAGGADGGHRADVDLRDSSLPLPGARARQRRLSRPSGWREARTPAPAERRERERARARDTARDPDSSLVACSHALRHAPVLPAFL